MSGSVMPAQNVAGSITSRAIAVELTLKRTNPASLRASEYRTHAIRSNAPLYTGMVAAAATPITS